MRKPTRNDAAWFIVVLPRLAVLVEPDFLFWLAMPVSILGLTFDPRKRDALVSLGVGPG